MADKHQQFIQACSAGNTDLAKQLQLDVPLQTTEFLLNAFAVAIEQKQIPIIEFLLQECPEELCSRFPDPPLLQAIEAGPEVYALFIRKDPSIARRSFGHMGDALGLAVMRNDAELVRLLLDNGASPSESRILHKPTKEVVRDLQSADRQIVNMLDEQRPEERGIRGWVGRIFR
ncbi:hypothetical protein F5Y10DRAFT_235186 [Nemania abortiva]|nr:hypothetical protein F5Y10DRAFT_235186 [Nemania abortiva]